MTTKNKNYYDELIRLLNQKDRVLQQDKKITVLIEQEKDTVGKVTLMQSRIANQRELADIEGLLKGYPLDEIYLFNNAVWSFNETRLKKCIKEVKTDFKNRDFSEPQEKREERLNLAICFLLGYLLMKGKALEAVILAIADEAGLTLVVSFMVMSGLYNSQKSSINNSNDNNRG